MNQHHTHYAFIIVLCCCLMMGVNVGLTFSCAGIFYKPLTSDLGISVGSFGLYMSFMYVASSLTLPFAGRLLRRYSARIIFTLASSLNGLSLAAMGLMSKTWEFYAVGALLGVSIAFLLYMSYPTLINRWFHTRMGLMTGICCAASGVGGIIFNPIGAYIITNFGWRMGYFAFGAIALFIVTPLLLWLLRDYPSQLGLQKYGASTNGDATNSSAIKSESGIAYSQAMRMPTFYLIVIFAFIMMGCSTLNLFIPGFVESSGKSLETASLAAAASMLGVTLGKLLLGYINDRNCMAGVVLCTLGGAAGIVALVIGAAWMGAVLGGSFFFGWCYAGVTVQTAMLTRTVMGSRDYARIYAIVSIALSAGGAFASGGWGLLADAVGYQTTFLIGAILLVLAFLLGYRSLRGGKQR